MAEKVKVSYEVGKTIDTLLGNHSKDSVLYLVSNVGPHSISRFDAEAVVFLRKNTSPLKLAEMLIKGYEVESTPEENLLAYFNVTSGYDKDLIRTVLMLLNIKIKGVNEYENSKC